MHFKNDNDYNKKSNNNQKPNSTKTSMTSTISAGSSTSSADSGVIIIDNRTTFGNTNININSDTDIDTNANTNSNTNTNTNSNSHTNENDNVIYITNNCNPKPNNVPLTPQNNENMKKCCNLSRLNEHEINIDKIENTRKIVVVADDKPTLNSNNNNNVNKNKCNINSKDNLNDNANDNANANDNGNDNDECNNISLGNINIENVIKISKGHHHHHNHHNHNHDDDDNDDEMMEKNVNCNNSPNASIRSTSISIVSIDENAIDSSVLDSDSDREADAEGVHTNYVVKKLGQQTTYPAGSTDLPIINKGLTVLSQKISTDNIAGNGILNGGYNPSMMPSKQNNSGMLSPTATPQIGSIALTNSSDVTFGDKHFYEGPVTIQQILIDRRDKWKASEANGHDNPSFEDEAADITGMRANAPPTAKETFWKLIRRRKFILIAAIIVILTILIGVIVLTTKPTKRKDNIGGGLILRIVARDNWLAQPPSKSALVPLDLPVSAIIVMDTQTDICDNQAMCTFRVRIIQTFNMESQQNGDIIYNFLIGGDGNIYEGRGWDVQGAHMKGYNNKTISFAYVGTFKHSSPNYKQMNVTKLLLNEGVRLGKLTSDFKIYGANKFDPTSTTTSSKGLYDSFKGWPHWSDT